MPCRYNGITVYSTTGTKDGQIYYDYNRVRDNIPKSPNGLTQEQKNQFYSKFIQSFPTSKYKKNLYDAVVKAEEYIETKYKEHVKTVNKGKGKRFKTPIIREKNIKS